MDRLTTTAGLAVPAPKVIMGCQSSTGDKDSGRWQQAFVAWDEVRIFNRDQGTSLFQHGEISPGVRNVTALLAAWVPQCTAGRLRADQLLVARRLQQVLAGAQSPLGYSSSFKAHRFPSGRTITLVMGWGNLRPSLGSGQAQTPAFIQSSRLGVSLP